MVKFGYCPLRRGHAAPTSPMMVMLKPPSVEV